MFSENFMVFIEFLSSYAWEVVKKRKRKKSTVLVKVERC